MAEAFSRHLNIRNPMGIPGIEFFGRIRRSRAQPSFPPHFHPGTMEIHYFHDHGNVVECGKREYRATSGDLFISPPGVPHRAGHSSEEKGTTYWLGINATRPDTFLGYRRDEARTLAAAVLRLRRPVFRGDRMTHGLFERLCKLYADQSPLGRIRFRNCAVDLLLNIASCERGDAPGPAAGGMDRIVRYMRERLGERLQVRDLAKIAGISVPHFKRRFREQTGEAPMDCFMGMRIDKAKVLLMAGRGSVTAAAIDLGFSSSQHFAAAFRKRTGLTPSAFARGAGGEMPTGQSQAVKW